VRRRALAAIAGSLAICGCDGEPTAVQVRIAVDSSSCGVTAPDLLPLGCEAELGVWLLADDGQTAQSSRCLSLGDDDGRTLRELPVLLGDAGIEFGVDTGEAVGLEVAIYSPRTNESCPRFDPYTTPVTTLPVYYGRSPVVAVSGEEPVIPLTLGCASWPPPEPPACGKVPSYRISATVTDLETLSPLSSGLDARIVLSFGDLMDVAPEMPALFQLLVQLIRGGIGATWEATLDEAPEIVGCPATRVDEPLQPLQVVSCQAESSQDGRQLSTVGYYIDPGYLPALEEIFGGGYPPQPMIVGRVVDSMGAPVPNAWVGAMDVGATVYYLSEDRFDLFAETGTSSNGYFFIVDIDGDPCCHTLWAGTNDDALWGYSLAPVAMVRDSLTAVLVVVQ